MSYHWAKPVDGGNEREVDCPRCGTHVKVRDGVSVTCRGCGAGHDMQVPLSNALFDAKLGTFVIQPEVFMGLVYAGV